jgi:hypothetical protein
LQAGWPPKSTNQPGRKFWQNCTPKASLFLAYKKGRVDSN